MTKYLYAFQDHMKAQNMFERLTSLIQVGKPNNNLTENLDRELIRASQHAENQCHRRPLTYWSIDLDQHKQKVSVFGQLRRRLKKGLSISALQVSAQERGIGIHRQPTVDQLDKEIKILQERCQIHGQLMQSTTRRDSS